MINKYMEAALVEAYTGILLNHGGPFGAAIVKDDKLIAVAHNTVLRDNDPTAHGEINAIRKACKELNTYDLSGCDIYTTGEPCPMCESAIQWANIDNVYYGCSLEDNSSIGFRDDSMATNLSKWKDAHYSQIDHESCKLLFAQYQRLCPQIY